MKYGLNPVLIQPGSGVDGYYGIYQPSKIVIMTLKEDSIYNIFNLNILYIKLIVAGYLQQVYKISMQMILHQIIQLYFQIKICLQQQYSY